MPISEEKIKEFAKIFEEEIYPTIVGEDGKGVERLAKLVEEKRIAVEERKKARENKEKDKSAE